MWVTYWFGIEDEESELCGEEFFIEVQDCFDAKETRKYAIKYAKEIFPNEKLTCYGKVTEEEAEMMGLDTY